MNCDKDNKMRIIQKNDKRILFFFYNFTKKLFIIHFFNVWFLKQVLNDNICSKKSYKNHIVNKIISTRKEKKLGRRMSGFLYFLN